MSTAVGRMSTVGGAVEGAEPASPEPELCQSLPIRSTPIFDLFMVVGLKNSEPAVFYKFETPAEQEEKGKYSNLEHFCYPSPTDVEPRSHMESETFTFVLTNPAGGRRIGFCRRYLPSACAGTGARYPEVLCIVSTFRWFSFFAKMLSVLENCPPRPSLVFLRDALAQPFPAPGQRLFVALPGRPALRTQCELRRPDDVDSPFSDVNFVPLFTRLGVENVLLLFAAMLAESRIIFLSQKLSRLSACIHAAAALLYPFRWEHVFIPILPRKMLHLATAPMPFLAGVHTSMLGELSKMPLEELIVVDLDQDRVADWHGESVGDLYIPSGITSVVLGGAGLRAMLKAAPRDDPHALHLGVTECFRAFFLALCGRYSIFLHRPEDEDYSLGSAAPTATRGPHPSSHRDLICGRGTATFDLARFEAHLPAPLGRLFEQFKESQTFDSWLTIRLDTEPTSADGATRGVFERECAELVGNIKMFGDSAPGPFSSPALYKAQQLRTEWSNVTPARSPRSMGGLVSRLARRIW